MTRALEPSELRARARAGSFTRSTAGFCPEHVHANLVMLPKALASGFREFCRVNPGPCPVIEETAPGVVAPRSAPTSDLRTDAPRYRIYRSGRLERIVPDVSDFWRDDLVTFLIGCSFNFEAALVASGFNLRHHEEHRVVPMFETCVPVEPSGGFEGPLVVSMRPFARERVDEVRALTAPLSDAHGAPLTEDAAALGIEDLGRPDYGEPVTVRAGEVPLFWACGVTPQAAARRARPELLITHEPGHMFVTDRRTAFAEAAAQGS